MSNLASQPRATVRRVPANRNTRGGVSARLYVARPTPVDSRFIAQAAQNFKNMAVKSVPKAQDQAHYAILKHLLSTTYANPAPNDPFINNYLSLRRNATTLYDVRTSGTLSASKGLNFIHDLIQIQANNIVVSGWTNINDTVLNSPFQKAFDALVASLNDRLKQLGVTERIKFLRQMAHRDAIQLIPREPLYADELSGIKITNNLISSTGELQGIFATDGLFRNITITGNRVNVGGAHPISINGLLTGILSGNVVNKPIKLLPLRIGGEANIYVIGFKAGTGYAYDAPKSGIDDQRRVAQPRGRNYTNVDIPLFRRLLPRDQKNRVKPPKLTELLAIMNRCGTPAG